VSASTLEPVHDLLELTIIPAFDKLRMNRLCQAGMTSFFLRFRKQTALALSGLKRP
jgi:hypothetical protein